MPRGQYDRSKMKKKGEAKTPAPAKKEVAVVAKAPKVYKAKVDKSAAFAPEANPAPAAVQAIVKEFDENYVHVTQKFQFLGSNLETLTHTRVALGAPPTSDPYTAGKASPIHTLLDDEIVATLVAMKELREAVFGKARKTAAPKVEKAEASTPNPLAVPAGVPVVSVVAPPIHNPAPVTAPTNLTPPTWAPPPPPSTTVKQS